MLIFFETALQFSLSGTKKVNEGSNTLYSNISQHLNENSMISI